MWQSYIFETEYSEGYKPCLMDCFNGETKELDKSVKKIQEREKGDGKTRKK
jgi:hypothetical protein